MKRMLGCGVLVTALVAGCGGGGGGGGGGGFTTVDGGSAYTGLRTAATVDAASAQEFGSVTTTGFEFGMGLNETVNPTAVTLNRSAALGRVVFQPAVDVATLLNNSGGRLLARSEVETAGGNCGGSVTKTTDVPDQLQFPLTVTGSAVFDEFCDDGATVDGVVRYLATIDEDFTIEVTEAFSGLSVSFADEQNPEQSQNLLLTGTIAATVEQLTDAAMTVNLNIEDVTGGAMIWFNYLVEATQGPGFGEETLNINGYVYHSEFGRVSLTTNPNSALADDYVFQDGAVASVVHDTDTDTPISGGFLIEGVAGNAAIIHVLSVANGDETDGYEVIVDDAAPLGTFDEADTVSGPHDWD